MRCCPMRTAMQQVSLDHFLLLTIACSKVLSCQLCVASSQVPWTVHCALLLNNNVLVQSFNDPVHVVQTIMKGLLQGKIIPGTGQEEGLRRPWLTLRATLSSSKGDGAICWCSCKLVLL